MSDVGHIKYRQIEILFHTNLISRSFQDGGMHLPWCLFRPFYHFLFRQPRQNDACTKITTREYLQASCQFLLPRMRVPLLSMSGDGFEIRKASAL